MNIAIYHNPKCSNSRGCLALIREAGHEPRIIEYLKTPPSRDALADLIRRMGIAPRDLVRAKEAAYAELGLANADDAALLDAMAAHPVLINRPIVVAGNVARLCRPPELVRGLLR
jgi:arsenate reductase